MTRSLLTRSAFFLPLLVIVLMLNSSFGEDIHPQLGRVINHLATTQDPSHKPEGIPCTAGTMPDISKDIEAWADWMDSCAAGSTGGGGGGGTPGCSGNPRTFTGEDGRCWRVSCDEGGGWKIIPCRPLPKPIGTQLDSVMVKSGGYTVHIVTAHGGRKEKASRHDVRLVHLLRAMVNGSPLPAGEIRRVPKDFWTSQKSLTLK